MKQYILSLDLGTQGTKAALLDLQAEVLDSAFSRNSFIEHDNGEIILPAEDLAQGVIHATREVLEKTGVDPKSIVGIGVVGMMAGIVGIDEDWKPLTHYDSGLDKRCESAIARMQELGEERVIALCGSPIIVAQGAKMYWWKETQPEIFRKIKKFVPASTYVCGCMAGLKAEEAYIDYTHIHLTCLADIEKNQWSRELLELFDFPEEKLPKIVAPYDIVGRVTEEWSRCTGLCAGTPVVAGCGDTAASAMGAGLVRENMVLDVAGTASCLLACVSEYRPDVKEKVLINQRSVIPGLWTPFGFVLGGQTLGWYFDQINYNGQYTFPELSAETRDIQNESLFFLPFFAGRICPSDAGFSGHWLGLKFYHSRAHMFKSIMESIAYEYRFYLNRMLELYPQLQAKELLTSAGGARSPEFNQVKADVLQLPVTPLEQKDTSHKAAAILAGYALGIYPDLGEAALTISEKTRTTGLQPHGDKAEFYGTNYSKYQQIIAHMAELHKKLDL